MKAGNAEVVKMARAHDPEGKRTLGVITKCDDAARAEASDIVAKASHERCRPRTGAMVEPPF